MIGRLMELVEMVFSLYLSLHKFYFIEQHILIYFITVSHSFGYGLMDAGAMVRLARVWKSVPPQQFCEIKAADTNT